MRAALVLGAVMAISLGACASSAKAPEWADAGGFPSLREVPTAGTSATTDASHWSAIETDLLAARAEVQTSPRAQDTAAPTEDPQQFLDEARREVEETRSSHNPY